MVKKMRKRLMLVLSVILAVTMLASCGGGGNDSGAGSAAGGGGAAAPAGGGDAAPAGERSKTFNIVSGDGIETVDPHDYGDVGTEYILKMVYSPLIDTDHAGNPRGELAESWEMNEDSTAITLKLRQGVKFTNGEDFNADTVVFNIQRIVDNIDTLNMGVLYFMTMTGAEKVDDYTVTINFSAPYPNLMSNIHYLLMIPQAQFEAEGDTMFFEMRHSGTGPWLFDDWASGQYTHFTKNPDYFNKAEYDSYFEDGFIRFVSEATSAATSHVKGDVDAYVQFGGINTDVVSIYAGSEDKIDQIDIANNTYHAVLRTGFPEGTPFYDEKVRMALDLAIDRQTISDTIYEGAGVPLGIMPEGTQGYVADLPAYEYDPERAKQLLAESSYDGKELYFKVCGIFPPKSEDLGLAISAMLEEVGFKVNMQYQDITTFITDINQSKTNGAGVWDLILVNSQFVNADPFTLVNSAFLNDFMGAFFKGADADKLNKLVADSNVATDPMERLRLLEEVNRFNKEWHGPTFAISNCPGVYMVTKGITGVSIGPDGYPMTHFIDWDPALAA